MVNREEVEVRLYDIITKKVGMTLSIPEDCEKELFYYNSKITPAVALYILTTFSKDYSVPLEKIKTFLTNNTFCYKNIVECICTYSNDKI